MLSYLSKQKNLKPYIHFTLLITVTILNEYITQEIRWNCKNGCIGYITPFVIHFINVVEVSKLFSVLFIIYDDMRGEGQDLCGKSRICERK